MVLKSKPKLTIAMLVFFGFAADSQAAQLYQRMVLQAGTFTIDSSGQSLSADCWDRTAETPFKGYQFASFSGDANVVELRNSKPTGKVMSLQNAMYDPADAFRDALLVVEGDGTHSAVKIRPLHPRAGVTYLLEVKSPGILGKNLNDLKRDGDLSSFLNSRDELNALHTMTRGRESDLQVIRREAVQQVTWKVSEGRIAARDLTTAYAKVYEDLNLALQRGVNAFGPLLTQDIPGISRPQANFFRDLAD